MPAPANNDEFLDLVRKGDVVEEGPLWRCLQHLHLRGEMPDDPVKLAGLLIRDGLLTHFQAEQFLQGKWRRFDLGSYKVLERLRVGQQGSVYLCRHERMKRLVAVKVLPPNRAADPNELERFYREARGMAGASHPNVIKPFDISQDEQLHFIVMEFVDGSTLASIVEKHGPMEVRRAAHYVRQAALGLQHAHELDLVHCDVEPANLMLDRTGQVKIIDLGSCRFLGGELHGWRMDGTEWPIDYLSPEQAAQNVGIDARTDVYSLGATFYFLLTGQPPFPEGTATQKLLWIRTRVPQAIREVRPETPPELAAIVMRMMERDREQRFQTAHQVAEALAPWADAADPVPLEAEMPRHCKAVQAIIAG